MRARTVQAARLENDYLSRVRVALAGAASGEIDEVIQSVQEHIEEELSEKPPGEVTLAEMGAVLERLGPPEAYAQGAGEVGGQALGGAAGVVVAPAAGVAPADGLDLGACWNDAFEVYKRNILKLALMHLLFWVLSILSLLILMGPLWGGMNYTMVKAIRRPDKSFTIGEMFCGLERFWALLGLGLVTIIPIMIGFALLIVPGLLLWTIWLYPDLLILEKGEGVFSSLRKSRLMVTRNGFGTGLLIAVVFLAICLISAAVPRLGVICMLLFGPLGFLLVAAAYNRSRPATG